MPGPRIAFAAHAANGAPTIAFAATAANGALPVATETVASRSWGEDPEFLGNTGGGAFAVPGRELAAPATV